MDSDRHLLPTGQGSASGTFGHEQEEEEDGLRSVWYQAMRVWLVLRRRWLPVLLVTVLGSLAVGVRLSTMPDKYETKGLVQVGMYSNVGDDDGPSNRASAGMVANTHLRLLESDRVGEAALAKFLGDKINDPATQEAALAGFLRHVDIAPIPQTFFVEVAGWDADPKQAAKRVNALMDTFIPVSNEFVGARFVVEQQQLLEKEKLVRDGLEKGEEKLQKLYVEHGQINFDDRRKAVVGQLEELQSRLTTLRIGRAETEAKRERLEALLKDKATTTEQLMAQLGYSAASASGGSAASGLATHPLAELRGRVVTLGATLGKDHPEVLAAKVELKAGEAALADNLRQLGEVALATFDGRQQTLEVEEGKLATILGGLNTERDGLDQLEGLFSSVKRAVDWYDKELESIRERLRRTEGRADVQTAAMIVSRAKVPVTPVSRITTKVIVITVLGMFVLALGLVVAWDHVEDTVSDEETARQFNVPILGRIPEIDWKTVDEQDLIRETASTALPTWTGEAFRLLRTNLTFAAAGIKGSAVLVTSGSSGDGKSTTSLHLAVVLGQAEGKCLIIDADMRKSSQQRLLGTDYKQGLSDVLAGIATLDECVHPTEFQDLDFLPSGPRPPNPGDLLVRGDFKHIIVSALERYDYVVVDSPPAVGIADTSIMAPHCKGVLYVLKLHKSRRHSIKAAIEQVEAAGARSLGMVLNAITKHSGGYGYGYGYGYGEGYGYGYGEKEAKEAAAVAAGAPESSPGAENS
jgi:capsular exopolysaccharide synthesis family protein